MTKKTFLIPWLSVLFSFFAVLLLTNTGSVNAKEYNRQSNSLFGFNATLSDTLANGATEARVGDKIDYSAGLFLDPTVRPLHDVTFEFDPSAGLTLSDQIDTTPLAYDDAYQLHTSPSIEIPVEAGLLVATFSNAQLYKDGLAADQDFDATPEVAVVEESIITNNGSVTLASDGSFTYIPSTQETEFVDSFVYTIQDGEGNRSSGTVTLNFHPTTIIYVNNQNGSSGDGSLQNPFSSLTDAQEAAGESCDIIFLFSSPQPYDVENVELLDCQKLVGQDYGPSPFSLIAEVSELVPAATAQDRPTIRCSQYIDYLSGINPAVTFPTTDRGCIELSKNNVVVGIDIVNSGTTQKGIAGENFENFWGYNLGITNSDGFSFSCTDSAIHDIRLTQDVSIENYGYFGIDVASFGSGNGTDCTMTADLTDVSIADAEQGAHEAVQVFAQANNLLTLRLRDFKATNIEETVVRVSTYHNSESTLIVENAELTDFDSAGIYVENYVFWEEGDSAGALSASVKDSVIQPNENGRGIMFNHQGLISTNLTLENNLIGQTGVDSDGIAIYAYNAGLVNANLSNNQLLARGAEHPNLPSYFTHAPMVPIYFENNIDSNVSCIKLQNNSAVAGYDFTTDQEQESVRIQVGNGATTQVDGWDGNDGLSGAEQAIQQINPGLTGGTAFNLWGGSQIIGGDCDEFGRMMTGFMQGVSLNAASSAPKITIPLLPAGKMVMIKGSAVINPDAADLDRVSNQGMITIGGQEGQFLTADPSPNAGFEDPNGRTVTPVTEGVPTPILSASDVIVEEDAGQAVVQLQLSASSGQLLSFSFATLDDSAVAGEDFTAASGVVTFAAGETAATVAIDIIDDSLEENDEVFFVEFSAPIGSPAQIGDGQAQITILKNDEDAGLPNLSAEDVTVSEGDGVVSVVIQLESPAAQDVGIIYKSFDGTAVAGADYSALNGEVTIPAGSLSASFDIEILDDSENEFDETFNIRLTATSEGSVSIKNPEFVVSIVDNDEILIYAGNRDGSAVRALEGGGSVLVDVVLSRPSITNTITVDVNTADLLAVAGVDYQALPLTTISFPPGETRQSVSISIIDDADPNEPLKAFELQLSNATNGTISRPTANILIIDNDSVFPFVFFEFADYAIFEDEDNDPSTPSQLQATIQLGNVSANDVTLVVGTSNGTATSPADYQEISNLNVTIPAGQTSATVTVQVFEDNVPERPETFSIFIQSALGAQIDSTQNEAVVTIADGVPPVIELSLSHVDQSRGVARFEAKLSGNTVLPVRFSVSFLDGLNGFAGKSRVYQFRPGTHLIKLNLPVDSLVQRSSDEPENFYAQITDNNGAVLTSNNNLVELKRVELNQQIYLPIVQR